jgi:hypothetical protein
VKTTPAVSRAVCIPSSGDQQAGFGMSAGESGSNYDAFGAAAVALNVDGNENGDPG